MDESVIPVRLAMHHDLSTIRLMQSLPQQDRDAVQRHVIIRYFRSGATIVAEDDTSNDVYLVFEGVVAAKAYAVTGHETAYAEIGAGSCFGEFSAIDNHPRSATIECLSDVTVGVISGVAFRRCMQESNDFALVMVEHLVRKLRLQMERFQEISSQSVDQRIRLELLRLSQLNVTQTEAKGVCVDPAPTHQAIARKVNTHREAVSREISDLERMGILKAGRQRIDFIDIPRLRKLVLNLGPQG